MTHYMQKSSPSLVYNAVVGRSAVLSAVNDSTTARRLAPVAVLTAATFASAQQTGNPSSIADNINITSWVDSLFSAVTGTMNAAGPGLYKMMGIIGGFFFVWNRLRSLW